MLYIISTFDLHYVAYGVYEQHHFESSSIISIWSTNMQMRQFLRSNLWFWRWNVYFLQQWCSLEQHHAILLLKNSKWQRMSLTQGLWRTRYRYYSVHQSHSSTMRISRGERLWRHMTMVLSIRTYMRIISFDETHCIISRNDCYKVTRKV